MRFILLFIALGIFIAAPASVQADADTRAAYKIKAAYLYNFIKFVDWPEETFPAEQSPVYIGILGESPFGPEIHQLETKTIQRHPIRLRFGKEPQDLVGCPLVYIAPSAWPQLKQMMAALPRQGVLTVSGAPDFNQHGGVIRFVERNNRVRFAINLQAAHNAELRISSRLLQLAIEVTNREQ